MKVGQLVTWASRRDGGVFTFASGLARALAAAGADSHAYGIEDPDLAQDVEVWRPVVPRVAKARGPARLGLAPGLLRPLLDDGLDVLHAHGLWTLQSVLTLRWARRTGRPFLVSPHGMLDAWALRQSWLRKRLAAAAYERRRLGLAACLHAVHEREAGAMRSFGLRNPICVLPSAVDLPPRAAVRVTAPWHGLLRPARHVLLSLSRLHPKKGLPALLRGWAQAGRATPALRAEWALVIAGGDEGGHEAELRRLAAQEGILDSVAFAGPLYGEEREAAYRCADAFVLASFSEGMPHTVLEAWARGLPVLMTEACGIQEGYWEGASLRVGEGEAGVSSALRELFTMSGGERRSMGEQGRRLVERRFSWPVVARHLIEVYRWLVDGAPAPDCVHAGPARLSA